MCYYECMQKRIDKATPNETVVSRPTRASCLATSLIVSGVKSRRLAEVKVRELTQYSHELAALPG